MSAQGISSDSSASGAPDPGSFRDPSSQVFHAGGSVYRALDERALEHWRVLEQTKFFKDGTSSGKIIPTELADGVESPSGKWSGVLRHETIPFVSYPYEWTFAMLKDAALLHLDLMDQALDEDMILKDSTPYNVQFIGSRPVFIDIGSFEILEPGDVWIGYRQFLQMFLYPLMLRAYKDVPFQPWMKGSPDGITAPEMRNLLSGSKLKKGVMLHVSLQARAEEKHKDSDRDVRSELKEAGFKKELIQTNVRGLKKIVTSLEWNADESVWADYSTECAHVADHRGEKTEYLRAELDAHPPHVVWDVGANDGHFSKTSAEVARNVVAMDADELVLDRLYQQLDGDEKVLPLFQDLAMPSPGLGWQGRERLSLDERANPDLILCFAVVHHLVIGRNVPLGRVVDWLASHESRLILEFVGLGDPMVKRLMSNKKPHEVHGDYNENSLRSYLDGRFVIESEQLLAGDHRRLFTLSPINRG
jgi:hypothetical protein